jgi:hypothetical protein
MVRDWVTLSTNSVEPLEGRLVYRLYFGKRVTHKPVNIVCFSEVLGHEQAPGSSLRGAQVTEGRSWRSTSRLRAPFPVSVLFACDACYFV